jgi:1,4-dihydroxy-2-naphthoate octaprenyltransferase
MSVSGITNTLIQQSAMPSPAQQWRNDFNDLAKALDNGDMNSAQKAVASLQQLQSGLSKTTLQAITGADAGGEAQIRQSREFANGIRTIAE